MSVVVPGIDDLVEIGRGGAGVVYRGHQADLGRDVAVKVVWSAGAGDADLARWRREVTAMARLSNHPNIVAVHDGGTTADGIPYLVMPYVPGGTLGDRLRREHALPADEVVSMGRKLAGALAAAHDAGVLHRDVKPDNVLISPYGEPQLADFGIARLADATMTNSGTVHATVAYAAPEVLAGQPATEASDVYGLGATLYACLAGGPPFTARDGEALVALAVRVTSDPPDDLRPRGVPDAVATVVEQAMAKQPVDRIPTATELARRLDEAGAAAVTAAAPTPPPTVVVPTVAAPVAAPQPAPAVAVAVATAPPDAPPSRRTPWGVLALVALAVLSALVGFAVVAAQDDDGDGAERATATQPEVTGAPATTPTTEATTATTAAATSSTTSSNTTPSTTAAGTAPAAPVRANDVAGAARSYFDAIAAGDFERAYAMTTPGFRAAQPYDGYAAFWGGFEDVQVQGPPRVDEGSLSATVRLRLGGTREDYTLTFVRDDDGTLVVDGPRPG